METLETSLKARIAALPRAAAVLAALLVPAGTAEAAIIDVTGSTLGCFGSSCTDPADFSSPTSSSAVYGLTFNGTSFDESTDASGNASAFSLGTIGRGNINVSDDEPALPFALLVTFSLPTVITGGQQQTFTAVILGTNHGGGGDVDVDFDNAWRQLTYSNASGQGTFEFSITTDLEVGKNTLTNPGVILGAIRNATFTPTTTGIPTADLPEPASLMLLGTGAAALALRRRRKVQ